METKMIDDKVLPIPMLGKELGRFQGATFYIAEYEYAILFHVYNSMDFIVRPSQVSCYQKLADYVRNKELYEKLEGEEKDNFEFELALITYVLISPLYAFISADFTYDIAKCVTGHLEKLIEENFKNVSLQEETPDENKEFEDAVKGLETIKNILNEENDG